ncbi:MAG: ATP-binding protein [Bacilli bacterium]
MNTIYMMVGIPGSGKTSIAHKLQITLDAIIVSSDFVRLTHPKWKESLIFPEVYRLIGEHLRNHQHVIFDATNIDVETRKRHLAAIREEANSFRLVAYFIKTDPSVCIKRIILRNQQANELLFPPEIVMVYHQKLVYPTIQEGFESVITIDNND